MSCFVLLRFPLATIADVRKSTGTTSNLGSSLIPEYGQFEGFVTRTKEIKLVGGALLKIEDMPFGLTRFTEPTNVEGNRFRCHYDNISLTYDSTTGKYDFSISNWYDFPPFVFYRAYGTPTQYCAINTQNVTGSFYQVYDQGTCLAVNCRRCPEPLLSLRSKPLRAAAFNKQFRLVYVEECEAAYERAIQDY